MAFGDSQLASVAHVVEICSDGQEELHLLVRYL